MIEIVSQQEFNDEETMSKNLNVKLYLLDGMALVYRAFFAFQNNPIRNSKGKNTSAVFGLLNTLLDILENHQPTHLAVAFDTSAPTFRHKIFKEYKAQREAMPEDLSQSIPEVKQLLEAMNIPVLEHDGFEADDIIGTIATQLSGEGVEVVMVTPDKDFAQLVGPGRILLRPGRKGSESEVLDSQAVCEKWDIQNPDQIIDILGLWGDASDNIPGVPGIGQKTASKLIKQFHSIEGILENLDKLKGKQKENLENFSDQARLSKDLATIKIDVPGDWELPHFVRKDFQEEKLKKLIVEFEFNTLGKKLFGTQFKAGRGFEEQGDLFASDEDGTIQPVQGAQLKTLSDVEHEYSFIQEFSQLVELISDLSQSKVICFDTETSSLNAHETELLGIAWSTESHKAGYVAFPRESEERLKWIAEWKKLFECDEILWAGHNLKFDLLVLAHLGIEIRGKLFDTMIAHAVMDPDQRHGMDFLAESLLGYAPISITTLIGEDKKTQISMRDVEIGKLAEYAAEDADITLQLFQILEPQIKSKGLEKVFYEIEMPLLPALVSMEQTGVAIDLGALNEISENLGNLIHQLESKIFDLSGREFNLNSPKQLGVVLFEELQIIQKPKKTKTGQYKTNEQVLQTLEASHPIVSLILDYRAFTKLKSTYVDALPSHVIQSTGRIHTSFGQVLTATGRLQSQDPNLQNIPIRSEEGREIRRAFISQSGLLMSADYSQIELRIIAALSEDPGMCEAFEKGLDIHAATAAKVFSVPQDEVNSEMRRKAKMVNFGIAYGISPFGLAQRLGISRTEAKTIIEHYFNQFPNIRSYLDRIIQDARLNGYVETICGRRRYLPDVHSANATVRGAAERNAINTPIQGTAADMIKIAMAQIAEDIRTSNLESRMILQVHDELVFEVKKDELDSLKNIVLNRMENAIDLKVPIVVDVGVGKNWLEAH